MATDQSLKFDDRSHAGAALGMRLALELPAGSYTVLGLLRGGVPIAYEVAKILKARLGALAVRKLGVPSNPELAFGAIAHYASGNGRYINEEIYRRALRYFGADELDSLEYGTHSELMLLADTFRAYSPGLTGQTVILCDDGIATGATMKASVELVRRLEAKSIVIAIPVAARESVEELESLTEHVYAVWTPENFGAVGAYYRDFTQINQARVLQLLRLQD
ncbi:phosphoribosyltransferase [Glutamicibacter arilaitensis]|uniref:Phosphoribosyltransferase n=1 Tax=Glutamicibacter arilaitensis TaxID=256701 RepID=A0A2N7S564_9MICC|nr:phosphoribosyltransferase family protein [Glutamicibacter arilaitensis]PMQ21262.1 phosphoribosyltransferase [Glutamicibacter arilaitensis]